MTGDSDERTADGATVSTEPDEAQQRVRRPALLRLALGLLSAGVAAAIGVVLDFSIWYVIPAVVCTVIAVLLFVRKDWTGILSGEPDPRRGRTLVVLTSLAALVLSFVLASYFNQRSEDRRVVSLREDAAENAGNLVASVLSYTADTIESDIEKAKTHLSGEFLGSYSRLTDETVVPLGKKDEITTKWEVSGTSVVSADPTSAVVLVFLRGTVTSKPNPEPTHMTSSVRARVEKSGDDWFVSQLEPL